MTLTNSRTSGRFAKYGGPKKLVIDSLIIAPKVAVFPWYLVTEWAQRRDSAYWDFEYAQQEVNYWLRRGHVSYLQAIAMRSQNRAELRRRARRGWY